MKKLKNFLLVLALLLSEYSLLFSDDLPNPAEMTDEEILTELIVNYESKMNLLNEREARLNLKEQILNEREDQLNQRSKSLTEINNYWTNLKDDLKNEWWNGFLLGGAAGLSIGFISGGAFGISIKLSL